uniref:MTOR-associated protein MEAK7 n=1 Tax=Sphenodon punctatus TaxID=8508 RepID=A0A8D0GT17_SPHPU
MGNVQSDAYGNHLSRFLCEEQSDIDGVFDVLSGQGSAAGAKSEKSTKRAVTVSMLQAYVQKALPEPMVVRLYNGLKSIELAGKSPALSGQFVKEQFVIFMSALLRGNAEEKSSILMRMISETGKTVKGRQIQEFAEDLITSVVHVLNFRNELQGWTLKNTRHSTSGVTVLASQLISELKPADGKRISGVQLADAVCDRSSIEDWVFRVPQISVFLTVIIQQGLHVLHSLQDQAKDTINVVPRCKGVKEGVFVSLLDIPSIMYINCHLPSELQHKWKLLFSSQVHGESFSQLCGHIVNKGPCILVLRDLDGYIFGGFSSHSWEVKPQFQGDNRCFLFSSSPSLAVYTDSGYNDHYMYLNHGQQTMPNGLGMGGQHDYFGLWIDSNYGIGHSKAKPKCTTYNSPQLSAAENFTLDAMEVWAVGDLPESTEAKGKRSILDVDPEAQALLEMTGKSSHSVGLRDQNDAADDDG